MRRDAEIDCHAAIELLPWYVNQTLEAAEHRQLEVHLSSCVACAREAEFLNAMQKAMPDAGADGTSAPPFSRLLQRINRQERAMNNWKIAAAVSLLLAVIAAVALPAYLLEPRYQTVTEALSAEQSVRLKLLFREDGDPQALPQIMKRYDADLISGPGERNEFVLEFRLHKDGSVAQLKDQLLAEDDVSLVDERTNHE